MSGSPSPASIKWVFTTPVRINQDLNLLLICPPHSWTRILLPQRRKGFKKKLFSKLGAFAPLREIFRNSVVVLLPGHFVVNSFLWLSRICAASSTRPCSARSTKHCSVSVQ